MARAGIPEQTKNPEAGSVGCLQVDRAAAAAAGKGDPPHGGSLSDAALVALSVTIKAAVLPDLMPVAVGSVLLADAWPRVAWHQVAGWRREPRPLHGGDGWQARRWPRRRARTCFNNDAREHVLNRRRREANALGDLATGEPFSRQLADASVPASADGCGGHGYSLAVQSPVQFWVQD